MPRSPSASRVIRSGLSPKNKRDPVDASVFQRITARPPCSNSTVGPSINTAVFAGTIQQNTSASQALEKKRGVKNNLSLAPRRTNERARAERKKALQPDIAKL